MSARPARQPLTRNELEARAHAVLKEHGLVAEQIEFDGDVHRCGTEDRPGGKSGWYVAFADDWPNIIVGDWRQEGAEGKTVPLYDEKIPLTPEERRERDAAWKRQRDEKAARDAERRMDAANKAKRIVSQAKDAGADNAYLASKRVPAVPGLKTAGFWYPDTTKTEKNVLAVPLINAHGEVVNCQRIYADGTKRYIQNGEKSGTYFKIPGSVKLCKAVYVCEGLATGISISEATGCSVISCCDAGNILPVLKSLVAVGKLNPEKTQIVIVADNDWKTAQKLFVEAQAKGKASGKEVADFNPGVVKARRAAEAIGCMWCNPVPDGLTLPDGKDASDVNDLFQWELWRAEGDEAIRDPRDRAVGNVRCRLFQLIPSQPEAPDVQREEPEPQQQKLVGFDLLDSIEQYRPGAGVFQDSPPPPDYCIAPLIERGDVACAAGPGGVGKSLAYMQAVFACGTGTPWLDSYHTGEPGQSWYISGEDSLRTMRRRSRACMDRLTPEQQALATENVYLLPLHGGSPLFREDRLSGKVVYDGGWKPFSEAVLRRRPKLIVIDPFSAVTYIDTSKNELMAQCVHMLADLAEDANTTIIYLHHVVKKPSILREKKEMLETMTASSILGGGQIVNAARHASLLYPLSIELANQIVNNDGRPFQSDGEVVVLKEVKKNSGKLEPRRYFRHSENCGLLEPCNNIFDLFENASDKKAVQQAQQVRELGDLAVALAQEAVIREQASDSQRVSKSCIVETLRHGGHNPGKSDGIASRAVDMGLVHVVFKSDLAAAGFASGRQGAGQVVVPSVSALKKYGKPDPARPGEFLNVSTEFRDWLSGLSATPSDEGEKL